MGLFRIISGPTCPSCEAKALRRTDLGGLVCAKCGVFVDADRGGWRFPMESGLRPLPGLAGMGFRAARAETEEAA